MRVNHTSHQDIDMKLLLLLLHVSLAFIHPIHRYSSHIQRIQQIHSTIDPSIISTNINIETTLIDNNNNNNIDENKLEVYINNLKQSPILYKFILEKFENERIRKELSFALFIEYNIISFLAIMIRSDPQLRWNDFSPEIKHILCNIIEIDLSNNNDIIHTIDLMWCLGKLYIDFPTLPESLRRVIVQILANTPPEVIKRDTSRLIYGISNMKLKWFNLPKIAKDNIYSMIIYNMPYMNEREVINVVYALGKLECIWYKFPEVRDVIIGSIQRVISILGRISFSNLIW